MFQLIVISHPVPVPGEAGIIQQLFEAGLACFHLRKPEGDEKMIRQLLDAIPAVYHERIALHGFHHLAGEYGIKRLHYTERERMVMRQLADGSRLNEGGSTYTLTTSVHDLATLQHLSPQFAYTFLSPVFNSISKEGYKGFAAKDFMLRNDQKPVPVMALGGIDEKNIRAVVGMNFDGAAVLGAIWKEAEKAVDCFKLLQQQLTN